MLKENTDKDLNNAPGVNAMYASGIAKDSDIIDGSE